MTAVSPIRGHPARGRARSRIEALERLVIAPAPAEVIAPHPMSDLAAMTAEEIGEALCRAVYKAHGDDPLWASDPDTGRLCRRCLATLDVAREAAARLAPDHGVNPLMDVFDDELLWRDEMDRWTKMKPGVTFDRAAFSANQQRQRSEHLYIDHYRGQIPPWVIVAAGIRVQRDDQSEGARPLVAPALAEQEVPW